MQSLVLTTSSDDVNNLRVYAHTVWRQQVYTQTSYGRPSKLRRSMSATKSTMQPLTYTGRAFHREGYSIDKANDLFNTPPCRKSRHITSLSNDPEPETKPVKHVSLFLPCRHFLTPFKVAVLPLSASAEVSPRFCPFRGKTCRRSRMRRERERAPSPVQDLYERSNKKHTSAEEPITSCCRMT